jgi:hypothetical protein
MIWKRGKKKKKNCKFSLSILTLGLRHKRTEKRIGMTWGDMGGAIPRKMFLVREKKDNTKTWKANSFFQIKITFRISKKERKKERKKEEETSMVGYV